MSVKASIFSTTDEASRREAVETAKAAIGAQKTVVIPTDTVYGIAADAFSVEGVEALLAAKGRSRQMPPPVLIYDKAVIAGLADGVSEDARALAERFWPGALTLIFYSQPSLNWDLGETQGTVALRVPNDPTAIELLRHLGPLAVSSANKTGRLAATTAQEAMDQLGNDVEVIFDGGPRPENRGEDFDPREALPSTIVDCTSDRLVVVREGAISLEELREVVPGIMTRAEYEEQERVSREAAADAERALAEMQEAAPLEAPEEAFAMEDEGARGSYSYEEELEETEEEQAPRARQPESGSLAAGLVASAAGGAAVDQRRASSAQVPGQKKANAQDSTRPYSTADARALVFSASERPAGEVLDADSAGSGSAEA